MQSWASLRLGGGDCRTYTAASLIAEVLTECTQPFFILDMYWQLMGMRVLGSIGRKGPSLEGAGTRVQHLILLRALQTVREGDVERHVHWC